MKKLLPLAFLLILSTPAFMQDCSGKIKSGQASKAAGNFRLALAQFTAAASSCGESRRPEIEKEILDIYDKIDSLKNEAEKAKTRAEKAEKIAKRETEKSQKEKERAEIEKKSAEIAKAISDSLLVIVNIEKRMAETARVTSDSLFIIADTEKKRTQAVLDKIYFYNDHFGLAYDKSKKRFGFIDKNLTEKIKFEFTGARSFDSTGLALVSYYSTEYLIDTLGNKYELIRRKDQLDDKVLALDHSNGRYFSISWHITRRKQLRILKLNDNILLLVPSKIERLSSLLYLELSGNHLRRLPAGIRGLKNLQALNLSKNKLKTLPSEIGELKNLQKLDLHKNKMTALPNEIRQLKSLRELDLQENFFSEAYIVQLRKDMPWCDIRFRN